MLRIEYSNSNNIDNLIFQESWLGVEYLDTDITTINWELEKEILKDGNESETIVNTVLKETFSIYFNAKNHFLQSLKYIQFCDTVTIYAQSGKKYEAKDFIITPSELMGSTYSCVATFYTTKVVGRGTNIINTNLTDIRYSVEERVTSLTPYYYENKYVILDSGIEDTIKQFRSGTWYDVPLNEGERVYNLQATDQRYYYKSGTEIIPTNKPTSFNYTPNTLTVQAQVMNNTFVEIQYKNLSVSSSWVSSGYVTANNINGGADIALTTTQVDEVRMQVQTHSSNFNWVAF